MTVTNGFITYQQKRRLDALRPKVVFEDAHDSATFSASPLLDAVIHSAPIEREFVAPEFASISTLDNGRVSLRDAISILGWKPGTALSFDVIDGGVSVCAVETGKHTISAAQGRCLLPKHVRRLLSMKENEQVYIETMSSPAPNVRIYPVKYVSEQLRRERF